MKATLSQQAGEALRRLPEEQPSSLVYATQRVALVEAVQRELGAKQGRVPRRALAFAVLTILLGLVVLGRHFGESSEGDLSFRVGSEATPGKLGQYYAAADIALPLRFADGSSIALSPGARARVPEAAAGRRVVLLETGAAQFHVVHAAGVSWNVNAGPYTVHVTGTAFGLGWDDAEQELSLDMHSGAVLVSGPGIAGELRVEGTQRLRARAGYAELLDERALPQQAAPSAVPPPAEQAPSPTASESAPSLHGSAPDTTRAPKGDPSSAALFASGRYRELVEAARKRGIENELGTASASELRLLADAARFSGDLALARRALISLRARYAGSELATAAAFVLGKMADDRGELRTALSYYDLYLAEGRELAPEALGRRMLTLQRLGEREECRRTARQYLRRFPAGPYAKKAESLAR